MQAVNDTVPDRTTLMPESMTDAVLIALGVFLILTALWFSLEFPVFNLALVAGTIAFCVVFLLKPATWLIAVPVSVAAIDLFHWSGRFFLTAHDFFLLASLGLVLVRYGASGFRIGQGFWLLVTGILTIQIAVTLHGLLPLTPAAPGNWNDFLASTNALREFKGIAWAALFAPFLVATHRDLGDGFNRWFTIGMLGALMVSIAGILWERAMFTGLLDFSNMYRVSGWFSAMYTGGATLDAFLTLTAPFAAGLVVFWRRGPILWLAPVVALGTLYALYVTHSRADYPAVAVIILVLAFGFLNGHRSIRHTRLKSPAIAGIALVLGLALLGLTLAGERIQQRFSTVAQDFDTRIDHWSSTLELLHDSLTAHLFGLGKGSFPRHYYDRSVVDRQPLATIQRHSDGGRDFIRFSASDQYGDLYLLQRFLPPRSGIYRLSLMIRSPSAQRERVMFEVCERHIFRFRKECDWLAFDVEANSSDWQIIHRNIRVQKPGDRLLPGLSRPIDIALLNRGLRHGVDIGQIQLHDPGGKPVLQNPGFRNGLDHWVISYGNHLRTHIKNVLVYWWFESGLVGMVAMLGLIGWSLIRLLRASSGGDWMSTLVLASVLGTFAIGLFDSLFDSPRIAFLLYFVLFAGLVGSYSARADFLTSSITGNRPTITRATAGSAARSHSPSEVSS